MIEEQLHHLATFEGINHSLEMQHELQAVFTTDEILKYFDNLDPELFRDPEQTFVDPSCGDGALLGEALKRRLMNSIDLSTALETLFGVDINAENVAATKERLLCGQGHLKHIVDKNIVCVDALEYHFRFDGSVTDVDEFEERWQKLFNTYIGENMKKYYYVYKKIAPDGKYYIGKHSTNNLNDGYPGSGNWIESMSILERLQLKTEILEYANSPESLTTLENKYINEHIHKPGNQNLRSGPVFRRRSAFDGLFKK